MKRRITLVTFDTQDDSAFSWEKRSLKLRSLKAAREDKLSFAFKELPSTLAAVLSQYKELCVRWDFGVSIGPWSMRDPFASRLPQGLHVHVKPSDPNALNSLCSFMKENIGPEVRCFDNASSFTNATSPSSSYFFDPVQSKEKFLKYLAENLCHVYSDRCRKKVLELDHASYVDLNYDSESQNLDLHVFWTQAPKSKDSAELNPGWQEDINAREHFEKIEVGVFERAPDTEKFEISLGGHYAIVGKSDELDPLLFSFPSRHHSLPFSSFFNCSFNESAGLHPKLKCDVNVSNMPHEGCTLHSFFDVPQPFFVDPYQLADDSVAQSMGIKHVAEVNGETDLEAPEWTVKKWGATVLAEVDMAGKEIATTGTQFEFEMPLHVRYLKPKKGESYSEAPMPWPVVFWACDAKDSWNANAKNPFRRHSHGYDDLFPPETIFYHFRAKNPTASGLQSKVEIPILDLNDANMIATWTMRIVLGGFFVLLAQIVLGGLGSKKQAKEKESKKDQ